MPERPNVKKLGSGELDQYGAERFEHQKFGTVGVEGVKSRYVSTG